MNGPPYNYKHEEWVAGHGDVLKHIILTTAIRELQEIHPEGVLLVDGFCGEGVFDLNQHVNPAAYSKGVIRVLQKHEDDPENTPIPVQHFIDLVYESTGCRTAADLDVYPGSPVLAQNLLRKECDEHRLLDTNVEEVQWLNNETADFRQANVYDSMEFILPYTDGGKHPIIFLDPDYTNESDFGNIKKLVTNILDQHPFATVIVWIPLLQNHKFRWSFPNGMREVAKKYCKSGRYYCSMNISAKDYQGSAVLVCNPTRDFDEIMSDECIHWLANTMNYGKDEFMVEQTNKKKKSASA